MIVVAKDGSGDYTSIQAAIDAAQAGEEIRVKPGEYHGRVVIDKPGLHLAGESRDDVVIADSRCAKDKDANGMEKGTFLSFTLITLAPDVTVENLTVRNDAGDGRIAGQAVAVYAAGDRGVWRNCRMIACQDTLFCGPVMRKVLDDVNREAC